MILDDDPVVLNYGRGILQKAGYRVIPACDKLQGKAIPVTMPGIDLIVTDNQIPGMTGLELAEILYMEHRNLPVILASSDLSEKVSREGQRLGIRGFLEKPYTETQLCGMVKAVLK